MKRARDTKKTHSVALALTWDGARWPVRTLPPKARAFLGAGSVPVPSRKALTSLAAADDLREIRICWVPQIKGGKDVLTDPFSSKTGKRQAFRMARTALFGDVFGVIYRRK